MKRFLPLIIALFSIIFAGCTSRSTVKTVVSPLLEVNRPLKIAVLPFSTSGNPGLKTDESYIDSLNIQLMELGFVVIERSRVGAVLDELNLEQSGMTSEQSSRKIGELLGADVLVIGTVNYRYVPAKSSGGSYKPFLIGPSTSFDSRKEAFYQLESISIRFVGTENGAVMLSSQASGSERYLKDDLLLSIREKIQQTRSGVK